MLSITDPKVLESVKGKTLKMVTVKKDADKDLKKNDKLNEVMKDRDILLYDINVLDQNDAKVAGVKGKVKVLASKEMAGKDVKVYVINDRYESEEVASTKVDENGFVSFDAPHFSLYMLAIDKKAPADKNAADSSSETKDKKDSKDGNSTQNGQKTPSEQKGKEMPSTSVGASFGMAYLAMLGLAGAVLIGKKRK